MSAAQLVVVVQSQAEKIAASSTRSSGSAASTLVRRANGSRRSPTEPTAFGRDFPSPATPIEERKIIPAHTRRVRQDDGAESGEELKSSTSRGSRCRHHTGA